MSPSELSETSDFKHIKAWLEGDKEPTVRQAEKLADKASIPFPYLLLERPVQEDIDLPDFRTPGSTGVEEPSPELEQVIEDCRARLDWYVDFAQESGIEGVSLFESCTLQASPEQAAKNASRELDWVPGKYAVGEESVSKLANSIEEKGVLVMRSSMVRNNVHRPLDPKEFRGFTLIDRGFALIFVNTRDAKSAQLFSLAHELAHVLLGQPGVSGESIDGAPNLERWCNLFAAEFLIPATYFNEEWSAAYKPEDAILRISSRIGVSPEAVIWRGVDLGVVDRDDAEPLIQSCSYRGPRKVPSGGNGLYNMRPRLGNRFLGATASAIGTDLLSITDALYYLGVSNRETARNLMNLVGKSA